MFFLRWMLAPGATLGQPRTSTVRDWVCISGLLAIFEVFLAPMAHVLTAHPEQFFERTVLTATWCALSVVALFMHGMVAELLILLARTQPDAWTRWATHRAAATNTIR